MVEGNEKAPSEIDRRVSLLNLSCCILRGRIVYRVSFTYQRDTAITNHVSNDP